MLLVSHPLYLLLQLLELCLIGLKFVLCVIVSYLKSPNVQDLL